MKDLNAYIIEANDSIEHISNSDSGVFHCANGEISYYEECLIYPKPTKDCLEVIMLVVYKKHEGTGSALVKALLEYAKSKGKSVVVDAQPLGDHISEDDLIKFYMDNGFVHDERINDKHYLIYKNE